MDNIMLKALAEIRKLQIVAAKSNPNTANFYDDDFVYAVVNSLHPIFHVENDPFASAYEIEKEKVESVLKILDTKWLQKEKITFYDLETIYSSDGRRWRCLRVDLINICRYAFLGRRFDTEFWEQLLSWCPSEAHGLTNAWSDDDLV